MTQLRIPKMRRDKIFATIPILSGLFAPLCSAQEPSGDLSVSINTAHQVVAKVTGTVARCGITALPEAPTFRRLGQTIEVTQPVAGVACLANIPPGSVRPYNVSVNLGILPPGQYTVSWSFPRLSATYVVTP